MATYRFDKFQAAMVADGRKRRTIRAADRKGHAAPGAALRLTTGRPKFAPLLEAVCAGVDPVLMTVTKAGRIKWATWAGRAVEDLDAFAQDDGFEDAAHMGAAFLKWHGPGKFRGVMIRW
jgi:hypothetical protein